MTGASPPPMPVRRSAPQAGRSKGCDATQYAPERFNVDNVHSFPADVKSVKKACTGFVLSGRAPARLLCDNVVLVLNNHRNSDMETALGAGSATNAASGRPAR
jgi:hypothetical protein